MNIVRSIIFVVLMLGVLATLHELGHFWVAKLLKIKVYEVSIFVGPKLLKWRHKDVDFTIRLIPIGAYVRFNQIDEEGYVVESDDPELLVNQPRFKRLMVSLAGPIMNLILGISIFCGIFCVTGFVSTDIGKPIEGAQTGVVSAQYAAGDTIKAVNGHKVYSAYDLYYEFDADDPASVMTLTLKSKENGSTYDLTLTPVIRTRPMLLITVESMSTENEHKGWLVHSVEEEQQQADSEGHGWIYGKNPIRVTATTNASLSKKRMYSQLV